MKNTFFLAVALVHSVLSFAQDVPANQVPSVVLNTFKKNFPKAVDVEWELKNNEYKVDFEINRYDHEAWINNAGNLVKLKQDIPSKELPKAVSARIASHYKGFRIDEVEKIEKGSKIVFKVELKKGLDDQDVYFDESGKEVENILP